MSAAVEGGLSDASTPMTTEAGDDACKDESICVRADERGGTPESEAGSDDATADVSVDSISDTPTTDDAPKDVTTEIAESCTPNACGGCSALSAVPGTACGHCGMYVCNSEGESIACQDPAYLTVKGIAAGRSHTCALTTSGGVRCWGSNGYGQLGDGSTTNRTTPAATDVLTGVEAIAAGGQHTCAVMSSGGVKCWGNNDSGQLGDGTTTGHGTPTDVLTSNGVLTGVRAIAAGLQHTCAITTDDQLRCWGLNNLGQLGDGTTTSRSVPATTPTLVGVQKVAAGTYHTCALNSDGLWCWGYNLTGQVGDGTVNNRTTPGKVMTATGTLPSVRTIAAGGYHTCAVTAATNSVRCWGANAEGQLGDGTTTPRSFAPDTDAFAAVQEIVAGDYATCVLTMAGGVRCWGVNANGELGDGTVATRLSIANTDILAGVTNVVAGGSHACAISSNGMRCWGLNDSAQIGNGTTVNQLSPSPALAICP